VTHAQAAVSTHFGRAGGEKGRRAEHELSTNRTLLNTKLEKVMTNQMADNEIEFPGEHLTPEQHERDRWQTMACCSIIMTTAKSPDERMACVETILDKFRDVPNQQPSQQDKAAYARFAVKTLLEALIKPEGEQEAASVATENVFNEWIDEWLPPPHATRITLPRM
jgi:hypothetical protein